MTKILFPGRAQFISKDTVILLPGFSLGKIYQKKKKERKSKSKVMKSQFKRLGEKNH